MSSIRRSNRLWVLGAIAGLGLAGSFMSGCQTDAQTGGLVGALGGAGLGAIIGHQSGHAGNGALIGAAAGGAGGYILGNESDKQRMYYRNPNYRY